MESVSLEHRQHMLMLAVSAETARGGTVSWTSPTSVTVVRVEKINHVLHAVLSLFTCGLWLLVWLGLNSQRKIHRFQLTADELGSIQYLETPAA